MVQRYANLVKKTVGGSNAFTSGSKYPKILINGTTGAYEAIADSTDESNILTPLVGVDDTWVVWEPDVDTSVVVNSTTYSLALGKDFDTMIYLDSAGENNVVHKAVPAPVLTAAWNTPIASAANLSWTNTYLSPTDVYRTPTYATFSSTPVANNPGTATAAISATTTVYSYTATASEDLSIGYTLTPSVAPSVASTVNVQVNAVTKATHPLPAVAGGQTFTDKITVAINDVITISVVNGDATATYTASLIGISVYAIAASSYTLIAKVDGPTIPGNSAVYADLASGVTSGNSISYMVMNDNGLSASSAIAV